MCMMCEDWTRLDADVQTQDRMGAEKLDFAIKRGANYVGTQCANMGMR